MTSLYSIIFGDGAEMERGAVFLTVLEVPVEERFRFVGRFRDVWAEKQPDGPPRFALYTRNGGPNREDQAEAITMMQAHPLYLFDRDDIKDPTYATFYFQVPEKVDDPDLGPQWPEFRTRLISAATDPIDMDEMWEQAVVQVATEVLNTVTELER